MASSSYMLFLATLLVSVVAASGSKGFSPFSVDSVVGASELSGGPEVTPVTAEGEEPASPDDEATQEAGAVEATEEGEDDEVDENEDDVPEEMMVAATIPAEKSLRRSLAAIGKEVMDAQNELSRARRRCALVGEGAARAICEEDNKRHSARLARLLSAEDQIQKKEKKAPQVDALAQKSAASVARIETELGRLRARARVAKLNGDEATKEVKRLDNVAHEYQRRANATKENAIKIRDELEDAEEDEAETQGAEIAYVAAARGVERGVTAPDLAARETLARAVRRELAAEAFYKRSRQVRRKAGDVLSKSRESADDEVNVTKQEVASVMNNPAQVVLHGQSISGLNTFGKSADFGGYIPSSMTEKDAEDGAEDDAEDAEEQADEERADEAQEEEVEATKDSATPDSNFKGVDIDKDSPLYQGE